MKSVDLPKAKIQAPDQEEKPKHSWKIVLTDKVKYPATIRRELLEREK